MKEKLQSADAGFTRRLNDLPDVFGMLMVPISLTHSFRGHAVSARKALVREVRPGVIRLETGDEARAMISRYCGRVV